jgi:hypothetical protein
MMNGMELTNPGNPGRRILLLNGISSFTRVACLDAIEGYLEDEVPADRPMDIRA